MEYSVLGNTGRRISRLGFGGAPAGLKNYISSFDPEDPSDRARTIAALRRALDCGVTYFDTAADYGAGTSERIFGEALSGIPKDNIFLATKCAPCTAEEARRGLERSLKNLDRDWIDLLQLHGTVSSLDVADAALRKGGMVEEMERMKSEGLVMHIGFTGEAQDEPFYRLLTSRRFDVMQVSYNIFFQHPFDPYWKTGSLIQAERYGIGIVAMRSLTSGLFQRWVRTVNPESTFDYAPALLQFQLSNPLVDVALVGMRSVEEVERNVAVVNDVDGRIDLRQLHEHYPDQ